MNTRYPFRISPALASTLFFIAFTLTPAVSSAAELRAAKQATVGSDEIITNDLYIAGASVASSGEVAGDLTAAGGNVLVTGPVGQDVIAAGGALTILGEIGDGIRAAGGTVTIGSAVRGDVVAAGRDIVIAGGSVGRDVVVFGSSLRIDSPVAGNVRFRGGEIYINAPISGNVEVDADTATLGSAAVIFGNFTYKARQEVMMEDGARVSGRVDYTPQPTRERGARGAFVALFALLALAKLLMIATGALVVGLFFRRHSGDFIKDACADPLAALGRGLVFLIILPILSILLLLSVLGVPLGALGLLGFAAGIILGVLLTPIFLGSIAYRWATKGSVYDVSWKTIVLGVMLYFVLGFVPFFGWAIQFAFFLLALGSVAKMKWNAIKKKRSRV